MFVRQVRGRTRVNGAQLVGGERSAGGANRGLTGVWRAKKIRWELENRSSKDGGVALKTPGRMEQNMGGREGDELSRTGWGGAEGTGGAEQAGWVGGREWDEVSITGGGSCMGRSEQNGWGVVIGTRKAEKWGVKETS